MQLSAQGAAFVRGVEGFVGHAYSDPTGTLTIGIGLTWNSAGFREWWDRNRPGQTFGPGATMTRDEADTALIFVMAVEYGKSVNGFFNRDVPQCVFDGTCSFTYNCGAGGLGDHWALLLKGGDIAGAAAALKTDRITSKGVRLAGLVNRRCDESQLIQFGDYTIGGFTPPAAAPAPAVVSSAAAPTGGATLIRGERGPEVVTLQTELATLKLYSGTIDGLFGYGTEAAVLAFQRAHGLTADGYAGPKTLGALKLAS